MSQIDLYTRKSFPNNNQNFISLIMDENIDAVVGMNADPQFFIETMGILTTLK